MKRQNYGKKISTAHEKVYFLNMDKPWRTYLEELVEAQQKLRARHEQKQIFNTLQREVFCMQTPHKGNF